MDAFWLNIGMAGAVVFVVTRFLKHMRSIKRSCDACRKEQHELVKNHIMHSTEAMHRLCVTMERFIDKLNGK